jgi:type IV pilus assembly protein PilA
MGVPQDRTRIPGEEQTMRKQKGFSLIELLIVVAIILIIAAIAIPNLLRSRMAANEASAVGSVRTINTSEVTYSSTYPDTGFAITMGAMSGTAAICAPGGTASAANACLIDPVLAAAIDATHLKSGYFFVLSNAGATSTPQQTYDVTADPGTRGSTGQRGFFSDQSGVIRANPTGTATAANNPLQ